MPRLPSSSPACHDHRVGSDDVSTVEAPVDAPTRSWFLRATGLDARRALAGSGLAVIVSTFLFAAAMWLGFPGIQRDGLDAFGLWLTLLAMWALATTVGPTLLAWFAGIPLDRWSRRGSEMRAAVWFGLLGGVPGVAAGVAVWFVSHSLPASVVFFGPLWFASGFVGRLGVPSILRRRWLLILVAVSYTHLTLP